MSAVSRGGEISTTTKGHGLTMKLRSLISLILATASPLISGLALPAAGLAAPSNLEANPTQIDFGPRDANGGDGPQVQIDFFINTGADISLITSSINGPDATDFALNSNGCGPGTVSDGSSCSVHVSFDPSAVAVDNASVDVDTDQGTVSVPLTGVGASGTLSPNAPIFNPHPYLYGSQYQNASFTNIDPGYSVSSYGATITGPDASFFSIDNDGCSNQIQWPGNTCNIGILFNPQGPGTKNAQLELSNNGSTDSAAVQLTATALAGPHAVAIPGQYSFGNVAIGSSSAIQQITVQNQGDFPLQIQQLFVIGGAPDYFPITSNTCPNQQLAPGDSCSVDVAFSPGSAGPQNGSLFIITNESGPITQVGLSGTAYLSPTGGSVVVEGTAMADRKLTCRPSGFPGGAAYAYSWLRSGMVIASESSKTYRVRNGDVGARISCLVTVTNPVGSEQLTSPKTGAVAPADLSRIPGSLVARPVCRELQAPARVGAASLSFGHPVTPVSPLRIRIRARGRVSATLDGASLGRGRGALKINPRTLNGYSNGAHVLDVRTQAGSRTVKLALGACKLAARAIVGRSATMQVSSAVGLKPVTLKMARNLSFNPGEVAGRVCVKTFRQPRETFLLSGAHASSNGIRVVFNQKSVHVSGLPRNTGVVRLTLARG